MLSSRMKKLMYFLVGVVCSGIFFLIIFTVYPGTLFTKLAPHIVLISLAIIALVTLLSPKVIASNSKWKGVWMLVIVSNIIIISINIYDLITILKEEKQIRNQFNEVNINALVIKEPQTQQRLTVIKGKDGIVRGSDGVEMVLIPAGEFLMGSNNGRSEEKPVHPVHLDAFYMDKYEVTNAQYKKFVDATGYESLASIYQGRVGYNSPNQPVIDVSWNDAKAYAEWAGERLPTEAEWEKAARGGLGGKKYVWGNKWPPPKKAGNFADETVNRVFKRDFSFTVDIINGYDDGYVYTAPVGSFTPNGYGLYDMAGNVWEWCMDWYDPNYYSKSPKRNPKGPSSEGGHVRRGSSWMDIKILLEVTYRCYPPYAKPVGVYEFVGFRCVVDAKP